jgi:trypsin
MALAAWHRRVEPECSFVPWNRIEGRIVTTKEKTVSFIKKTHAIANKWRGAKTASAALTALAIIGSSTPAAAIVGGTNAIDGEFPPAVSIEFQGSYACIGAYLGARSVLTTAHCVDGRPAGQFRVRGGTNEYANGGQVIDVVSSQMHEQFGVGQATYANDIAILQLRSSFDESWPWPELLAAAVLPADNANQFVGTTCQAVGWGRTGPTLLLSTLLQRAPMPVILTEEAQTRFASVWGAVHVWDNQMGLFDSEGLVTMEAGDGLVFCPSSGLTVLTGIRSWGVSSNGSALATYPTTTTRISSYLNWISNNTP